MDGARHALALLAPCVQDRPARIERRVGGGAALGRRVPDVPGSCLQQLLDEGLKQLHDVDFAAAQGLRVARHRLSGDAIEPGGIEARPPHVLLQAQPGRRHLADGGHARLIRSASLKSGFGVATEQEERVARHHLAEADEVATGIAARR